MNNYHDFDTSDYAMFSMGEVQQIAEFANPKNRKRIDELRAKKAGKIRSMPGKRYRYGDTITGESRLSKKAAKGAKKKGASGAIKPHTRRVGGKVFLVRQGLKKNIGRGGSKLAALAGGGSSRAGKAILGATKVAGANPLIAAGLAGGALAGAVGGAGYAISRKKRRRE